MNSDNIRYLQTTPGTQMEFNGEFGPRRRWWQWGRNWLGETQKAEHERRIHALEVHINELEERLSERVNYITERMNNLYLYDKMIQEQNSTTLETESAPDV